MLPTEDSNSFPNSLIWSTQVKTSMKPFTLLIIGLIAFACKTDQSANDRYESENLIIEKVSDRVYLHVSYLQTDDFGKVACNGMIVIQGSHAIVFDSPTNDESSRELIEWLADQNCKSGSVIPTHFHKDCLGGIQAFHESGYQSYAFQLTNDLAKEEGYTPTKTTFDSDGLLIKSDAGEKVLISYFGEGHTRDNIVGYVPDQEVLFGGCLIKSAKAGKGFLGDASTNAWSETVRKIKEEYPNLKIVIPGHGKPGGIELLDYTIEMFDTNN